MKYIITIMACLIFVACGDINIGSNTDTNVTAVIVMINQNEDAMIQTGKTTSPALCNTALFKNTANNLHFTFTTCGNHLTIPEHGYLDCTGGCHNVNLNDAWVYGHSVGDTVHFTYVNRLRYFIVKNKSKSE